MLGVGLWFFVHESGVHATIAGVLLAFAIPTRTRINAPEFSAKAAACSTTSTAPRPAIFLVLTSKGQQEAIIGLERASEAVTAPLLRLEHALHGSRPSWSCRSLRSRTRASTWADRPAGQRDARRDPGTCGREATRDYAAALAAVRLRLATLPEGVSWTALHGCAWLGGIGFTMSLFIATLAFDGTTLLDSAKVGILGGSIVSGVVGAIVVRRGIRSA